MINTLKNGKKDRFAARGAVFIYRFAYGGLIMLPGIRQLDDFGRFSRKRLPFARFLAKIKNSVIPKYYYEEEAV